MYQDGTYLENNPTWHEEDSPWKAAQIKKMFDRNALMPKTVCEVGCGAGAILETLRESYPQTEFSGYEVSPQAFEICEQKAKPNLSFYLRDLLEDESAYFDVVMAIDIFEHVDDYLGFLRKLRPKGEHKLFHIPLDISVQTVLRASPIMWQRRDVGHIHYFTKETALATLTDCGYEIVDHFYTGASVDRLNDGWKKNVMILPRRLAYAANPDLAVRVLGGYSLMVLAR